MVALLLVVVGGLYYIAIDVLGFHLGAQPYTVSVVLPRAGGLYPEADVTYRGVPVGKVAKLQLSTSEVRVELQIKHGVHIPVGSSAHVRQLSSLGEQYMDLVPYANGAPYLHNGSVIPENRTTVPLPIGTVLHDTGALVAGIDPADIHTVEQVLASGFTGSGTDLRRIIVTGQSLAEALIAAQSGTLLLVNDGNTILHTALATSDQFARFNAAINQLTATFKNSNREVAALLSNGSAAAQGIDSLLIHDSNSLQAFVANFGAAGSVSYQYKQAVQALFAVLPVVASDLSAVGSGGQLRGELGLNTAETVCPYVPSSQQAVPTQPTGSASLNNTCSITAPDLLQRGAQNAPVVP
jgi:phospholipid/cholesterol/gamma-HCH transport system substrate-binding protein